MKIFNLFFHIELSLTVISTVAPLDTLYTYILTSIVRRVTSVGRRGAVYRDNVFLGHSPSVAHVYEEVHAVRTHSSL